MHKFGVYTLILGVLLTVMGLVVGFGAMFMGDDELAKVMLAVVPVGFVVVFVGVVTTLLVGDAND